MLANPNVRKWIYAVAAGVGAALAALGVVDSDVSNQILAVIAGLLTVGVGGLALPNTPAKPPSPAVAGEPAERKPVSVRIDLPAAAAAVEKARVELEQRLGRHSGT